MNLEKELEKLIKKRQDVDFKKWNDADHIIVRLATMREDIDILNKIADLDVDLINLFNYLALRIAHYHGKDKSKIFLMQYVVASVSQDNKELNEELQLLDKEIKELFE